MKTIQPFDLTVNTIESLLYSKNILLAKDNKSWHASIFADTIDVAVPSGYNSNNIITKIDSTLFSRFTLLNKVDEIIYTENGTKRDYIKSIEIGDYNDSIKRYLSLDIPLDCNQDANQFLKLNTEYRNPYKDINIGVDLIYQPDINIKRKPINDIFNQESKNPNLTSINTINENPSKYNNKLLIETILNWAYDKNIKYIYCINEYRPYVINSNYVTNCVYYTIKGSY